MQPQILERNSYPPYHHSVNRPFIWTYSNITRPLRHLFTSQIIVNGLENLLDKQTGEPLNGPFLFMINHESHRDFINLPPIWNQTPQKPVVKALVKHDAFSPYVPKFTEPFAKWLFSPAFVYVKRTWKNPNPTEKDKKANREKSNDLIKEYSKHDIAILPAGTSKTDGHIPNLQHGIYHFSRFEKDKKTLAVKCIPVGFTYDFLSGSLNRHIVFANLGEYFTNTQTNSREFAKQVRRKFVDLSTITTDQLGATYLFDRLKQRKSSEQENIPISFSRLEDAVSAMVSELEELENPVYIDSWLTNSRQRRKRVECFYRALKSSKRKYIVTENNKDSINPERVQLIPESDDTYKKENILLYAKHRLDTIRAENQEVDKALDKAKTRAI